MSNNQRQSQSAVQSHSNNNQKKRSDLTHWNKLHFEQLLTTKKTKK